MELPPAQRRQVRQSVARALEDERRSDVASTSEELAKVESEQQRDHAERDDQPRGLFDQAGLFVQVRALLRAHLVVSAHARGSCDP